MPLKVAYFKREKGYKWCLVAYNSSSNGLCAQIFIFSKPVFEADQNNL